MPTEQCRRGSILLQVRCISARNRKVHGDSDGRYHSEWFRGTCGSQACSSDKTGLASWWTNDASSIDRPFCQGSFARDVLLSSEPASNLHLQQVRTAGLQRLCQGLYRSDLLPTLLHYVYHLGFRPIVYQS